MLTWFMEGGIPAEPRLASGTYTAQSNLHPVGVSEPVKVLINYLAVTSLDRIASTGKMKTQGVLTQERINMTCQWDTGSSTPLTGKKRS